MKTKFLNENKIFEWKQFFSFFEWKQFHCCINIGLLHIKAIFLNKTAEVIEHKNQETLAENRATEYKQTMI